MSTETSKTPLPSVTETAKEIARKIHEHYKRAIATMFGEMPARDGENTIRLIAEDITSDLSRFLGAREHELRELRAECERLSKLINSPELIDFQKAVVLEAAHQRERWGSDHDAGKMPADWFWLVGYVAGKALSKPEKRLHHIITTAAVCANWHAAELGLTDMRPGISEDKTAAIDAAMQPSEPREATQ